MQQSRPLGAQERLFHHMHQYRCFMPMQILHIRGELDADRVRAALAWLQRRHPMLRAHVRYGGWASSGLPPYLARKPFFETSGTTAIPLAVIDGDWEEVMARELKKPLPKDHAPRMRVTLVRNPGDPGMARLIFLADHATIDAASINMLCRQLLDYVSDPQAMESKEPSSADLPPAVEERFPKKPSSGTRSVEAPVRVPTRPALGKRLMRVIGRHLDAATAAALKSAARERGTTLHGVLTAAFLLSMRDLYGVDELTTISTIDMRRLCRPPVPAETFGCYVDILRTRIAIAEDLWATARDVSFKLITALAKDQEVASILRPWRGFEYRHELVPLIKHRARIDPLALTTAGESGLKRRYGDLELVDVTMAVSIDLYGPTMMVIASEREGRLDLSINYSIRVLTPEDATTIADYALAALHAAVAPVDHAAA